MNDQARPARMLPLWHMLVGIGRTIHLGAVIMVLALTPSSYQRERWPMLALHVYQATAPLLLGFTLAFALVSTVLIRIVVVTAGSYGLSQYAVEVVIRVLLLELLPLAAALFVALRSSLAQAVQVRQLRRRGAFARLHAEGKDALHWLVLPRALSSMFAVFTLIALSGLLTLLLTFIDIHGFAYGAVEGFVHQVGRVFSPVVAMVFAFKTFFFALTVALVPLASSLQDSPDPAQRQTTELQLMLRLFLALLSIQLLSLVGTYY